MPTSPISILRAASLSALCGLAMLPASAQDRIEGSTLDGATFSLSSAWVIGETLPISGENWTTNAGNRGSVIGVKYDFGDVVPLEPIDELDDLWARITASSTGSFAVKLPFPAHAGWEAGQTHTIHLLTGMLGDDDKVRNPTLRITIVESEGAL